MTNNCPEYRDDILPVDVVLMAYRHGYFPMADNDGSIYWHSPDMRAIIPFDKIKVPKSLRQSIRRNGFEFRINTAFDEVIRNCADRDECWINEDIICTYKELNEIGFAHSVETYKDGKLVGGLYGVAIGGAFFGESMFSNVSNASKAAFYFLAYKLIEKGFILLDSQYINTHTELLGAIEIPREVYLKILKTALSMPLKFP